jgi:hypothetical protein
MKLDLILNRTDSKFSVKMTWIIKDFKDHKTNLKTESKDHSTNKNKNKMKLKPWLKVPFEIEK